MRLAAFACSLLLVLCAACDSAASESATLDMAAAGEATPGGTSYARGSVLTLVDTPQTDPPALAVSGDRLMAFWIGSDERGVHQDAALIQDGAVEKSLVLPLPPNHPFSQRALAVADGAALLFWLDQGTEDETALFVARISPDLQVERGPVQVSAEPVYNYAITTDGAGGAWVVWSGGAASEPALNVRQIDYDGRPLEPLKLGAAGDFPQLTYDLDGAIWAFWLANGRLWRGRFIGGHLVGDADPLTAAIQLEAGDFLSDLRVGSDGRYGYVFWNVVRQIGHAETWMMVGSFNDPFWAQPRPYTDPGGSRVEFVSPLDQPASPLPTAVVSNGGLSIVYWQNGISQTAIPAASPVHTLRPPALIGGANGDLSLAWAEPGSETAALELMQLQP